MKIDELLREELIFLDLAASDKMEVINYLADKMSADEGVVDSERLLSDIIQREEDIPTGLENGAAIPHARSIGVSRLVMSFARLKDGVDFGAQDGQPAKLIFQFGVPPAQISAYLKMLAKLSRLLKKSDLIAVLLQAKTPSEVVNAFSGQ